MEEGIGFLFGKRSLKIRENVTVFVFSERKVKSHMIPDKNFNLKLEFFFVQTLSQLQ